MASHTKSQPNSGFNRRLFLAGAAGGAMLPVAARAAGGAKKKRGIYADPAGTSKANLEDKVADFSYQNDVLAQLIVEMWQVPTLISSRLTGSGTTQPQYQQRSSCAKTALEARGIYLAATHRDHGRRVRRRFQFGRRRPSGNRRSRLRGAETTHVRRLLVGRLCLRRPRC